MATKVFVDGQEGTTGLEINQRLAQRPDVRVLRIDPERRKDPAARKELLDECDVAFLCLPDDGARESVSLTTNPTTRIIDASTAHRTDPAWVYGLPELNREQRRRIAEAKRVAVPGCYATGFVVAVAPLVQAGIMAPDYPASCNALSGYSGGGKKLIAAYEAAKTQANAGAGTVDARLSVPRAYALSLKHKHLPEMQKWAGLDAPPLFAPTVAAFYRGMAVSVPLFPRLLARKVSARDVHGLLSDHYAGERFVRVVPFESEAYLDGGFFDAAGCNMTNRLDVFVFGNETHVLVVCRLDNLGKGASGAAVQCMNIMLGVDEAAGLD